MERLISNRMSYRNHYMCSDEATSCKYSKLKKHNVVLTNYLILMTSPKINCHNFYIYIMFIFVTTDHLLGHPLVFIILKWYMARRYVIPQFVHSRLFNFFEFLIWLNSNDHYVLKYI